MKPKDAPSYRFSEAQGRALLMLARRTISNNLASTEAAPAADELSATLGDECFKLPCGTFVTLKIKDRLRGCIGNLTSTETVLEGVRRNSINAALHDPRFSPLSQDELLQCRIEVSILSEPQPLIHSGGQDLIKKLRPHVDGLIIRKGHASATFLPQVWEQLPEPEEFLAHLCLKAGLPSDDWKNSDLEVSTYQVQYFEE